MRLVDRVVVVTGASRGLGRAMADGFVEEGARVVYAARDEARLAVAVEAADAGAGEAMAVPVDVRSWTAVRTLVARVDEAAGAIDVLVNNAGVTQATADPANEDRPVSDLGVSTWETVIETNLRGAFLCAKAVLPGMLDRGSGRLVHVTSGHGVSGRATRAAYVASKFGLEGLHETLALELADTGVDSVTLRPPGGGVYTARAGEIGRSRDEFDHEPGVIVPAAVRLAAGEGENGGRYRATADGDGYVSYSRT